MPLEIVRRDSATENLPAYPGVPAVIQIVGQAKPVLGLGQGIYRRIARRDCDGLSDNVFFLLGVLFDYPGAFERFEVLSATAVWRRQFGAVDLDDKIIDSERIDRSQTMLDGFYTDGAFLQARSSAALCDIQRNGFDPNGLGHIRTNERYTGIDRGGPKNNLRLFASEQPLAGYLALSSYRFLQVQGFPLSC
jgi:hypothetical protein